MIHYQQRDCRQTAVASTRLLFPIAVLLSIISLIKKLKHTFMKARLQKRIVSFSLQMLGLCGVVQSYAQTTVTGPSTLQTPFAQPLLSGGKITSILSANDSIGGYPMAGTPDGLGAFDNGDGTFTLLMNHEFVNTVGAVRAHGSKGAFVSKWIINKSDLVVQSGMDLMQNINLWNGTGYDTYNAANPSSLAAFSRFCSADLAPVSAYYNSVSGNGTQERIFMNGEEVSEGRAMAHIVTGPNAGTSYQLPFAGKMAFENQVANAYMSDKTIIGETDDASITTGNVYFYIGTKTNTGTEIDKAGLNNGKLYGVKVTGFPLERASSSTINALPAPGTHFDLVDLGDVTTLTGAQLDAASATAGATYFSRPEDGAWDPSNLSDFYFNTTDQIDQVKDGIGTQEGRSRVWRLRFDDINNPELGGTIEAVLDGTEGQNMLDNMTIDKFGHIILLEDVGNSAHNGKIWQYDIATDSLTMIGKHDAARFGDINVAATAPFNQHEETSGVIDVQEILGPGMYLLVDQAHSSTGIPSDLVENGQLLALYNCTASYSYDTVTACGSYTWNGQTYDTSGIYSFTGTNAAGCDSIATLVLTINQPPAFEVVYTPIVCYGSLSTSFVNASGGTGPYTYQLNQRIPTHNSSFSDLKGGRSYQMIVADANGCSKIDSFTIVQPAKIVISPVLVNKPSCQGGTDGSAIITANGGVSPYQFKVNSGSYTEAGTYGTFNGLSAGTYSISVKDANSCVVTYTAKFPDGRGTCPPSIAAANSSSAELKAKALALEVKVQPNPTATSFSLIAQSNSTEELQVIVTDVYGKTVFTTKGVAMGKQYTFGSNFTAGVYFVKVIQGKNVETVKVIKGKG